MYLFCDGIAYIGSNVMYKFLRFHENKNIADHAQFPLVRDTLTVKKVNQLFEENTFDIPFGVERALIHLGLQESMFKNFDSSQFQNELQKLVVTLRDIYRIKHIVFALIAPVNFPNISLDYWKNLEEVNEKIYFTATKQDNCLFWNAFSPFVKRNELVPTEKKWFKYTSEGAILYDIKKEFYKVGGISHGSKPDYASWDILNLNKLTYDMCSFFKKYCGVNIFKTQPYKDTKKDEKLDSMYGKTDEPVVFNLNHSILDVLDPVDIEYSNKDVSPKIKVQFGKIDVDALIDNGCSHVLMNESVYERIVAAYPELKKSEVKADGMGQKFSLAATKAHPKITKMAYVPMSFPTQKPNKSVFNIQAFIVKDLNTPLILGRNLMRSFELVIHTSKNYIELTDPTVTALQNKTFKIHYNDSVKSAMNFELLKDPKQYPLQEKKQSRVRNSRTNIKNDLYATCRQSHIHPIINSSPENLKKTFSAEDLDTRVFVIRNDQEDTLTIKKQNVRCPIAEIIEISVSALDLPTSLSRSIMESEIQRVELYIREYLLAVFTANRLSPCKRCLIPKETPNIRDLPSLIAVEVEGLTEFLFEQMETLSRPISPAPPTPVQQPKLSTMIRRAFSENDLILPPAVFSFVHDEEQSKPIATNSSETTIDLTEGEEIINVSDGGSDDVFEENIDILNQTNRHLSTSSFDDAARTSHSTEFENLSVSLTRLPAPLKSALKSPNEGLPPAKKLSYTEEDSTGEKKTVGFRFPEPKTYPLQQPRPSEDDPSIANILATLRQNSLLADLNLRDLIPPQNRPSTLPIGENDSSSTSTSAIVTAATVESDVIDSSSTLTPSATATHSTDESMQVDHVTENNVEKPIQPAPLADENEPVAQAAAAAVPVAAVVPVVLPPPQPAYVTAKFPRLNYAEIDGIQIFCHELIDDDDISECRLRPYVPEEWPESYRPYQFEWDPSDRVFEHLATDLWEALIRGTYVHFKIVVPRFEYYDKRQSFEWPRIDIEAVTWRNHLNLVRSTYRNEIYPREHVYRPRWSYQNQTNMKHLVTVLGKIANDYVEIIIDPTLQVSLINTAALEFFDKNVSFEFEFLRHPKVVYVPWKDEFRLVVRRKVNVPLKLTPGIDRNKNDIHWFSCYVANFATTKKVEAHHGTVILGVRDIGPLIKSYDPQAVSINLRGPPGIPYSRTVRCKEKVPRVRMIGLLRSLRAMDRFRVRDNFYPVEEYLIKKKK
ncbi:uncharacterized protein LOC135843144 [Planococcus citri]|uniref:uncharacterized protein LOC135843144 n=1 Tax=Planococcus citri TaxID=170843 RepID=UPI0031F811B3